MAEYGQQVGIGPRKIFKALLKVGLLQREIAAYEVGNDKTKYIHRARLTPEAVSLGLGRRINPHKGTGFDVLTPKGRAYATTKLDEQSNQQPTKVTTKERVKLLLEAGRSPVQIIDETGIPKPTVYRHIKTLKAA